MWKPGPLMLTVGISMQLQWYPHMRDLYKGAIITNLWFFSFLLLQPIVFVQHSGCNSPDFFHGRGKIGTKIGGVCACWPPRPPITKRLTKVLIERSLRIGGREEIIAFPRKCNSRNKGKQMFDDVTYPLIAASAARWNPTDNRRATALSSASDISASLTAYVTRGRGIVVQLTATLS